MSNQKKKRRGDRKDATLVRNLDALHIFMPYLMPHRADNEAVLNDELDLTEALAYIEKKNAADPDFKYTIFHVMVAALAKTIYLRPSMNRFIQGHRLYLRDDISFSFVVKKQFADNSEEALVIMKVDPESGVSPMDQVHDRIKKEVNAVRKSNKKDGTTDKIEKFNRLPRWLMRIVAKVLFFLDYYGKVPDSLQNNDPDYSTCFISNLGSIKMSASYHHLVNWGTNSFFVIIGEKKKKPVFAEDGSYEMREILPVGMTIDERIADGFYFAKSVKLLRAILKNPEILDQKIDTPIEF